MDPTPIHNIGAVDRILLGMCSQPAMRRDEYVVEEVTNHLFETSSRPFGMDLMAINIQRGRDHGIPSYLAWREACGLTPIRNWGQLLSIMDDDTVSVTLFAQNLFKFKRKIQIRVSGQVLNRRNN